MRTTDDREPSDGALRPKNAREQRLVARAGGIVVAITGRAGKIALVNSLVEKGAEDFALHALLGIVGQRCGLAFRLERRLFNAPGYVKPLAQLRDHLLSERWRS